MSLPNHSAAEVDKPRLQLGIGEAGDVDLLSALALAGVEALCVG
jgi:hypothetical protein